MSRVYSIHSPNISLNYWYTKMIVSHLTEIKNQKEPNSSNSSNNRSNNNSNNNNNKHFHVQCRALYQLVPYRTPQIHGSWPQIQPWSLPLIRVAIPKGEEEDVPIMEDSTTCPKDRDDDDVVVVVVGPRRWLWVEDRLWLIDSNVPTFALDDDDDDDGGDDSDVAADDDAAPSMEVT